jgi:hypothetical protein
MKMLRRSAAIAILFFGAGLDGQSTFNKATVTIANGASLSSGFSVGAGVPLALEMPSSWTAANITFQASQDGTNYSNLYDMSGTEITVVVAASRYVAMEGINFAGFSYLKLRSGTSGTPVNQGGARTSTVVSRKAVN